MAYSYGSGNASQPYPSGQISSFISRVGTFLVYRLWSSLTALLDTASARNATLVASAWLVCICLSCGCIIFMIFKSADRDARNAALDTSVMVSAYVRQTVNSGNIVLRSMQSLLTENEVTDEPSFRQYVTGRNVHEILRDRVSNLQEIDKAAFISSKGEVLNFSFKYPVPAINVIDRDYFQEQMAASPPPLTLGMVALDRGSGKWTFYLSQRILSRSGSTIGLAIVGLKADFLAEFFAQTSMRDDVAIIMQRSDGVVLTGSGISHDAYGKRFSRPSASFPREVGSSNPVLFVSDTPTIPVSSQGNSFVEAATGIAGIPANMVVIVNRTAFLATATLWSGGVAFAAIVGAVIVILSWWRSLKLIRDGFRASRISSMQVMTSAIAHELNQPLAAATNFLAAATTSLDSQKSPSLVIQREAIGKAQSQLLRAGEIISRLRNFISNGKSELRVVELMDVIQEAVEHSRVRELHNDIEVHLNMKRLWVRADRIQLQQVLINLIRNSAEAMAGRLSKRIDIYARPTGSRLTEITVRDTGPGLPPGIARHAFEPFNTTKSDGMGVGLAICRVIVESQGGTIQYVPERAGAHFAFTLCSADSTDD